MLSLDFSNRGDEGNSQLLTSEEMAALRLYEPKAEDKDKESNDSVVTDTEEQHDDLYPFQSVDGRVRFDVQRTGDHEFSLYEGRGVAHYGLYADQIADMIANSDRPREQIEDAVNQLFTSAEAYLRMWERLEQAPR